MDTDDYCVEEVLREARCFMVPLCPRKFQWGGAGLQPFWDDVCKFTG